jgi:hypothetical protein
VTKPGRISLLMLTGISALTMALGPAGADARPRVVLRPDVVGLFRRASISVTGLSARTVDVRLAGATDESGPAYEWTPYHWRRLQLSQGAWRGSLPSPALRGIYQLQVRVGGARRLLQDHRWLLRVFDPGTRARPSFATPAAVIRAFVAGLPDHQVLRALRRWGPATFDHRDPRLNRLFVIAYSPRDDDRPATRRGLFIAVSREGYHGRWRLLETTAEPYD